MRPYIYHIIFCSLFSIFEVSLFIRIFEKLGLCTDGLLREEKVGMRFDRSDGDRQTLCPFITIHVSPFIVSSSTPPSVLSSQLVLVFQQVLQVDFSLQKVSKGWDWMLLHYYLPARPSFLFQQGLVHLFL